MAGTDRRLADYVRWFDGALPAPFCAQMIRTFEQSTQHHVRHGRGLERGLELSGWVEQDVSSQADPAFQGYFMSLIEKYLTQYNALLPHTLPLIDYHWYQELRIKRYQVGTNEQFQPHVDALGNLSHRYLVFLWYLNDVVEGGETLFCDLDLKVSAKAGRLLMFPPYWMFQHAGLPPISNDKYILSTYMLFPPDAGAKPHRLGNAQRQNSP